MTTITNLQILFAVLTPKKMAATQRFLGFDGANDQVLQTNRKSFMELIFRPVEEKPAADTDT